jgi:hypothetical protein
LLGASRRLWLVEVTDAHRSYQQQLGHDFSECILAEAPDLERFSAAWNVFRRYSRDDYSSGYPMPERFSAVAKEFR